MVLSEIKADHSISATDKAKLVHFAQLVEQELEKQNPPASEFANLSVFQLCEAAEIDLSSLAKEGQMLCAVWVLLLSSIKKYLKDESLRYPKFDDFLEVYGHYFSRDDEEELRKLWKTANCMHVLFQIIPARKNKGLAMLVVPRVVEGWGVKYVTGSGQTHYTANRVHVFEVEGDVRACHRGKLKAKPKKKPSMGSRGHHHKRAGRPPKALKLAMEAAAGSNSSVVSTEEMPRKRRRTLSSGDDTEYVIKMDPNEGVDTAERPHRRSRTNSELPPGVVYKYSDENENSNPATESSELMPPPIEMKRIESDVMSVGGNQEMKETYKLFRKEPVVNAPAMRDDTLLLIGDLTRSSSFTLWGLNDPNSISNFGSPAGKDVSGPSFAVPEAPKGVTNDAQGANTPNNASRQMKSPLGLSITPMPLGTMKEEFNEALPMIVPNNTRQTSPQSVAPSIENDKIFEVFGGFSMPQPTVDHVNATSTIAASPHGVFAS